MSDFISGQISALIHDLGTDDDRDRLFRMPDDFFKMNVFGDAVDPGYTRVKAKTG